MNSLSQYHVEESVFYITNVCNLTCHNCETFNNKKFKGHFRWKDHQDDYQQWSRLVSFGLLNIHGGEPFTNPELLLWATELKKLWPSCNNYTISSNGTLLKNNIELTKQLVQLGWTIDITIHDPIDYESINHTVLKIIKDFDHSVYQKNNETIYTDIISGKILISIIPEYYFYKSSNKFTRHGTVFMHRSDPEKAHAKCISGSTNPCRFFVRGLLFKCPLTAISQDLIDQFSIEDEAATLLKEYKAASPYDSKDKLDSFFNTIFDPIKQCTLCPEKDIRFPIYPLSSKK
jgi:organic radical activating enzyme